VSTTESAWRPASGGRLVAALVARAEIPAPVRDSMWLLFRAYYDEVERDRFDADLDHKDHVILLSDRRDRTLRGFATLTRDRRRVQGREVVSVFTGDTIVDAAYWGQNALQRAFYRYLVATKLLHPSARVYWFLISKGYKTYLLLSRNFPDFWPRHDRATPAFEAEVLHTLAAARFGDAFLPGRGVLHYPQSLGRLRHHVAPLDAALLEDPDIRFFAEKNPGHVVGDELCCLGRVDLHMLAFFAGRTLLRPFRRRRRRAPAAC
jgi:hypothetical protein